MTVAEVRVETAVLQVKLDEVLSELGIAFIVNRGINRGRIGQVGHHGISTEAEAPGCRERPQVRRFEFLRNRRKKPGRFGGGVQGQKYLAAAEAEVQNGLFKFR